MDDQAPAAQPPQQLTQQINIGLADTPEGQRLAITVTTLLDANAAKQIAEAVTKISSTLSPTGLVVASGILQK